jgi:hypothetical protein
MEIKQASRQDTYYELESIFQEETAAYLKKLTALKFSLQGRKKDFSVRLCRRVDFVISSLQHELVSLPESKKP